MAWRHDSTSTSDLCLPCDRLRGGCMQLSRKLSHARHTAHLTCNVAPRASSQCNRILRKVLQVKAAGSEGKPAGLAGPAHTGGVLGSYGRGCLMGGRCVVLADWGQCQPQVRGCKLCGEARAAGAQALGAGVGMRCGALEEGLVLGGG
eukprot:scaffold39971_cov18-Tisochrysis_lutea.AAC.1